MNFNNQLIALTIPAIVITYPQVSLAQTGQQVNQLARETTVVILGEDKSIGSGVIVSRDNNTYYVLTSNHVIGSSEYKVVTPEGQEYAIEPENVQRFPNNIDLAIVAFTSDKDYQIATLGPSNYVEPGLTVFVSGWPKPGQVENNQLVRHLSSGSIASVLPEPVQGYQFGYNNTTQAGMSGGPVFDLEGRVVAIHGLANYDLENATELSDRQIDPRVGADLSRTGFNYGIPIDLFIQQLPYHREIFNGVIIETQAPSTSTETVEPEVTQDTGFAIDVGKIFQRWLVGEIEEGLDRIPLPWKR